MSRRTTLQLQRGLIWGIALVLTGCSLQLPIQKSPDGASQKAAQTAHFAAEAGSPFKIEFDYPAAWKIQQKDKDLWVFDPTKPEPAGGTPDFTVARFSITVKPAADTREMDTLIDTHLAGLAKGRTLAADQPLTIDTYTGRFLSDQITWEWLAWLARDRVLISDEIYVFVQDRYYVMKLMCPEAERQGEFCSGFDQMVKSIRFVK